MVLVRPAGGLTKKRGKGLMTKNCVRCSGSGQCLGCTNGTDSDGNRCVACNGNGRCTTCNGTGKR